jgi:hypothetical protein
MRTVARVLSLMLLGVAFTESMLGDDPLAFARDATVGTYLKNPSAPEWRVWITGMGVGFSVVNHELKQNKRPLFCFPEKPIDPKAVLDAWIAKNRVPVITPQGEYLGARLRLEVALLIAYEDAFPCGEKSK